MVVSGIAGLVWPLLRFGPNHPEFRAQSLFYVAFKMRLIMLCLDHGETQKDRFGCSSAGPKGGRTDGRRSRVTHGPFARLGPNDLAGYRQGSRGWAGDGGSPSSPVPGMEGGCQAATSAVGRAAAGAHETGGRAGLFGGMEGQSRAGSVGGGDAAAGCSGTKVGSSAQALGGVSSTGTSSLAQSRARYPTSQGRARCPGGVEKKRSPKSWRPC